MAENNQIIIQDEITRKGIDAGVTVGDLCMDAVSCMMERKDNTQRFTVLKDGMIYFFDVVCVAIKPPYQMNQPEVGELPVWFGQRMS